MDWEGLATIMYFNALWGFMGHLYMALEIQAFLLCFFAGMLLSLAVAMLVGRLFHLDHAPSSRTSQTRKDLDWLDFRGRRAREFSREDQVRTSTKQLNQDLNCRGSREA